MAVGVLAAIRCSAPSHIQPTPGPEEPLQRAGAGANEVKHAQEYPCTALFVVSNITVGRPGDGTIIVTGGKHRCRAADEDRDVQHATGPPVGVHGARRELCRAPRAAVRSAPAGGRRRGHRERQAAIQQARLEVLAPGGELPGPQRGFRRHARDSDHRRDRGRRDRPRRLQRRQPGDHRRLADRVPGPDAGDRPVLGEAAQHQHARLSHERLRLAGHRVEGTPRPRRRAGPAGRASRSPPRGGARRSG